jgi:hypothetical protein
VPAGVTSVTLQAFGAEGGGLGVGVGGGQGGHSVATITVTPGETLFVYVGRQRLTQARAGGRWRRWQGGERWSEYRWLRGRWRWNDGCQWRKR